MMDAYSFGKNQEDLDIEYNRIKQAYSEIFETSGLKTQSVGADSRSIGGNKSEEFMVISNIGEDNILFDEATGKAFNSELLDMENGREYLKETYGIENVDNLKTKKALELRHIFKLGDKYAKSMNATYTDKSGKNQIFIMGCYGIGVSRTLAMIYEQSIVYDKNNQFSGICLPINIAPYSLYIVPKLDDEEKTNKSIEVYKTLLENKVNVLYDDRDGISIGVKIKDSKITGTPYTAVFGKTLEEGFVEVENNLTAEKTNMKIDELIEIFTKFEKVRKYNIILDEKKLLT